MNRLLKLTIAEILQAIEGELYIDGGCYTYNDICTDTRNLKHGSIFIALKGDNFNGNKFVEDASNGGSVICIVDEILFKVDALKSNTTVIKVKDTKVALKKLAKFYRSKLNLKIIGVTGSTGKTSTKDLIAAALSYKFNVFKTKGNYNNEIGLPLMIFNLDESYDVAVLEMGMNNLNEIHNLADISRPDIAVITNIGVSHIENLKSRENILKAKLEITDYFTKNNILILNGDNDLLGKFNSNQYKIEKIGIEQSCDYNAVNIMLKEDGISYSVAEKGSFSEISTIALPVPGKHNILNSLLAIACARELNLSYDEIRKGFLRLESTSRRLDIIKNNDVTIVDDSYNASPDSMKAAIDVISDLKGNKRIAILGTMKELGEDAYFYHKEVGSYVKEKKIDLLIVVGEYWLAFKEGFENDDKFKVFSNLEEIYDYLIQVINKEDIILIKASRAMKFENIVEKLKR